MPEPVRSHAVRNRERILQAASEAFAESGDASLNAIAKRAGVGAGTLYRHFPTREDLILAVYRNEVQPRREPGPRTAGTHAPLDAFRMWLTSLADYVRGQARARRGPARRRRAARRNETYAPVTKAVAALLNACVADGS